VTLGYVVYVSEEPAVSIFIIQVKRERIHSFPGRFLFPKDEKNGIISRNPKLNQHKKKLPKGGLCRGSRG